jgi:hypothetical protein
MIRVLREADVRIQDLPVSPASLGLPDSARVRPENKPFRGYRLFSSRERADRFVQGQWQTLSQDLIEQTVANIRQIRRDEIPAEHYVSLDENVPVTWAALLAGG